MAIKDIIYFYDLSKKGIDTTGTRDVPILTNERALLESVVNILQTEPGQRIMYPDFGIPLKRYLFEPMDIVTATLIQTDIEEALLRFEPRIDKLNINVTSDEANNTFIIDVIFSMKITQQVQRVNLQLNQIR